MVSPESKRHSHSHSDRSEPVVDGARRWFLRGLGGATLAIPALPSLLAPRQARAALQSDHRFFIGIMSAFGGCWARKMFPALPADAMAMDYAGRRIRRAPLVARTANGTTELSEVLRAPSTVFTPALAQKMTLLQGLDLPFDTNHHSAATFGNYAEGDGKVKLSGGAERATIDQVIAQSPAFYDSLDGVTQRSVFISHFGRLSYKYKIPGNINSGVTQVPTHMNPGSLWQALFGSGAGSRPALRPPIVDLVREDYARLRNSDRLAAADKQNLDEHIARISDIERRLTVTISCAPPRQPGSPPQPQCGNAASHVAFYNTFTDILIAALSCGLTRVATILHQGWSTTFGERCEDPWHQEITHKVDEPGPQESMVAAIRRQFADVIVPLVAKLDAARDASGKSLLDRSLVYWTQEHGVFSHAQENIPVVAFGSGNGRFATGLHLDYRNLNRLMPRGQFGDSPTDRPYVGLTWHQMLGTIARGFGIPHAEWREPNHGGFGLKPTNLAAASYGDRFSNWTTEWNVAGDNLPWWLVA